MALTRDTQEGMRVVVFVRDADVPQPDKYATSQLAMLLQQVLTYNGFYDKHNDFIGTNECTHFCYCVIWHHQPWSECSLC